MTKQIDGDNIDWTKKKVLVFVTKLYICLYDSLKIFLPFVILIQKSSTSVIFSMISNLPK